jgi:sodium transport system permease protein
MNWSNVKLIFLREVRDQLRDRRTLFMIAVLPMLLYPLLGMSLFQVVQFMRERPAHVLVVGLPEFAGLPPLVAGDHFAANLFTTPDRSKLLKLDFRPADATQAATPKTPSSKTPSSKTSAAKLPDEKVDGNGAAESGADPSAADKREDLAASASLAAGGRELQQGSSEVVVNFPPDFAARLDEFRTRLRPAEPAPSAGASAPEVPSPALYYNSAKESSQVAYLRVNEVLTRWIDAIGRQNLEDSHVPATAAKPFSIDVEDVAAQGRRNAALWSKILPFVLLLWALTGAFYPAIDLCAGEKERGTLETLLSSPAERIEIVWGKLLTIMLFSIATAILNLASSGVTGLLVARHLDFGPPPLSAVLWLLIALLPTSALFSGLCLSLAAFARSTKEGQYYLMPLVLITMPLTILPMAPGVELNIGNSLIPVTGMLLLLRTLLDGEYALALPYVPVVVGVTVTCCLLAVRWAADQFNSEAVLFREGERLDMGLWLRHLRRDRENTPSVAQAVLCGVLILTIKFFMGLAIGQPEGFRGFAESVMVMQIAVIATPALLMAVMLTRSPAQTLLLRLPALSSVPAAVLLAVSLHPLMALLRMLVMRIYPLSEGVERELSKLLDDKNAPLGAMLLVVAVAPALFEELAFRGFILSGLRHMGHKWRAIVLSSIFFGVTHAIFQQSLITCIIGLVLGYIAVQTGSLLPGIAFHMTHNALQLLAKDFLPQWLQQNPVRRLIATASAEGEIFFTWQAVLASLAVSCLLLVWFHRLPYTRTEEEELQEAIEQQAAQSVA